MLIHRAVAFVHVAVAGMEEWSMEQASEGGREARTLTPSFARPPFFLSPIRTDGRHRSSQPPTPRPPRQRRALLSHSEQEFFDVCKESHRFIYSPSDRSSLPLDRPTKRERERERERVSCPGKTISNGNHKSTRLRCRVVSSLCANGRRTEGRKAISSFLSSFYPFSPYLPSQGRCTGQK